MDYVNNIYDVQIALEGVAASIAATQLTSDELAELRCKFNRVTTNATVEESMA